MTSHVLFQHFCEKVTISKLVITVAVLFMCFVPDQLVC